MLFLQGTRDRLADRASIESVCRTLSESATLCMFEGADHSFRFLKSAGPAGGLIFDDLAAAVRTWVDELGDAAS